MLCPYCNHPETRVTETRDAATGSLSRRRRCQGCGRSFRTLEHIDAPATAGGLKVRIGEDTLVPFDLQKLRKGIEEALARPSGTDEVVDAVVARAGKRLSWKGSGRRTGEITIREIEQLALEELTNHREIYAVSRIRYALGIRGPATANDGLQTVSQVKAWLLDKSNWPYGEPQPQSVTELSSVERPVMVRKKSPRGTEPWSTDKLQRSIAIAARGREPGRRTAIVESSSQAVRAALSTQSIVTTGQIETKMMDVLRSFDPVSYLRYTSAAKGFRQAREFWIEANDLERQGLTEPQDDPTTAYPTL